jgi:hypothetical protein
VREDILPHTNFAVEVEPSCIKVHQLLLEGTELEHAQQACRNLLEMEDALWTFVTVADTEPTNSLAERTALAQFWPPEPLIFNKSNPHFFLSLQPPERLP